MEDFQDGNADGWKAGGEGTAQLSVYAGNYSMRLTKNAYALTVLPVTASSVARVSAAFAAANLERKDACILDVSMDRGESWKEIFRIEDGVDDSVTLHAGSGEVETPDDESLLIVRLRIDGNADNDTCWADNIEVVVTASRRVDLILHNGPIFSANDHSETFAAIAINDDRIVAVGGYRDPEREPVGNTTR